MLSGAAANSPSHALVYPVVYLQHGGGEDETGWIRQGNANFILDNLIASDASKPIIIVMANGYAQRAGQTAPDLAGKPFLPRLAAVTALSFLAGEPSLLLKHGTSFVITLSYRKSCGAKRWR